MTGKQENLQKAEVKMEELLVGKRPEIRGFYNSMRQSGKTASYKTRRAYVYSAIKFLDKVDKPVDQITYDDIVDYLNYLSVKEDGGKKTGSYMAAVHAALTKFFKYLYKSEKVTKNYMEMVERPAATPVDQVVRVSLTRQEFNDCVNNTREDNDDFAVRDELVMAIFITTGIRLTAMTEINLDDIVGNTLKIIDKGNHYREFLLTDDVMRLLKKWSILRRHMKPSTNALFVNRYGKRISQDGLRKAMIKRCALTGKHITPHKFRRSCATWLSDSGSSIYEIQQFIGHASPQTTEIYLQNKEKAARKAGAVAGTFFSA